MAALLFVTTTALLRVHFRDKSAAIAEALSLPKPSRTDWGLGNMERRGFTTDGRSAVELLNRPTK